ncbi:hypothetical protein PybrP1_005209, partial [[Pythium] brassicae (nom. inval.)]
LSLPPLTPLSLPSPLHHPCNCVTLPPLHTHTHQPRARTRNVVSLIMYGKIIINFDKPKFPTSMSSNSPWL